jgi:DNA-binding MarR family transcriptional regulator
LIDRVIVVTRPSLLQREIRQRRPFQSVGHEAVLALLRTTDLVRRRLADAIEPHGLTTQQFNVLRILRGAGKPGLPTLDVAERMVEQTPGITRLLDRLEAKALVRRQRCPKDRRQHLCWITSSGRALVDRLDAPTLAAIEQCLEQLARGERTTLIRLLEAIRNGHLTRSNS